jgi:hypothetical protein
MGGVDAANNGKTLPLLEIEFWNSRPHSVSADLLIGISKEMLILLRNEQC